MTRELSSNETHCPGCGAVVERLSNCGRYDCTQRHGFPIVLDSVHRRSVERKEGEA